MKKYVKILIKKGSDDFMKNRTSNKEIDKRRYVNYVLMMVAAILIVFIAFKLYNTLEDNKLSESVFTKMARNIHYDDIENAKSEMSSDTFILISYTKNAEVKNFEERLKKVVITNELQDKFYYLDATDLMLEDGFITKLNEKMDLDDHNKIDTLPAIIYYKDGVLMSTISSNKETILSSDDFEKLLDSYEVIESKGKQE